MKILIKCAVIFLIGSSMIIMPAVIRGEENPGTQTYLPLIIAKAAATEEEELPGEELVEEKPAKQEKSKEQKPKQKADYSNVQAIPYNILVGEYTSLKEEKFRAELYAKRIIDIPRELASAAEKNKKIAVMGTKKGDNKQYLIVQNDKLDVFRTAIKSGKSVKFIFTPVALYNSCPVLLLIDVID